MHPGSREQNCVQDTAVAINPRTTTRTKMPTWFGEVVPHFRQTMKGNASWTIRRGWHNYSVQKLTVCEYLDWLEFNLNKLLNWNLRINCYFAFLLSNTRNTWDPTCMPICTGFCRIGRKPLLYNFYMANTAFSVLLVLTYPQEEEVQFKFSFKVLVSRVQH